MQKHCLAKLLGLDLLHHWYVVQEFLAETSVGFSLGYHRRVEEEGVFYF